MAEPDAESDVYKVPIEIEFFDRLGTLYTKNETVGLIVGAVLIFNNALDTAIYTKLATKCRI